MMYPFTRVPFIPLWLLWMLLPTKVQSWSIDSASDGCRNQVSVENKRQHRHQQHQDHLSDRRTVVQHVLSSLITAPALTFGTMNPVSALEESTANVNTKQQQQEGLVSTTRVGELLRVVPTFTIVDVKGSPFMVVGEDAKVTGYFFTTFEEANRILTLAKTSADKAIRAAKKEGQQDVGTNPWTQARISTVPLDFAVTLASKSTRAAYFRVAPADSDVKDALAIIQKDDLAEGKVPLFYFEDFTIGSNANSSDDGTQQQSSSSSSPLYFRQSDLLQALKREHKGQTNNVLPPPIQVTELFSVLTEMVKPGGSDTELTKLVFVPPQGSIAKAKEIQNKSKAKGTAFDLSERIIVL